MNSNMASQPRRPRLVIRHKTSKWNHSVRNFQLQASSVTQKSQPQVEIVTEIFIYLFIYWTAMLNAEPVAVSGSEGIAVYTITL